MYYMKIAKTFRLSEEAAAVLEDSDNATQLVENLLLDKGPKEETLTGEIRRLARLIEYFGERLDELTKKASKQKEDGPIVWPTKPPAGFPTRSRNDITTEIAQLEAERDERLEYSQDFAENKRITLDYKTQIDALWAEFHSIGKESLNA